MRGPARIGTESMEMNRSWSTPAIHLKRGSLRTFGTTSGVRCRATQPVTPSPSFMRAFPTAAWLNPLVAVRTRT